MIFLKEFYSKKYLMGIIFLIPFFYSAQNQIPQIKEIDLVLFAEIKKLRSESKFNDIISLSEKAIENSQKIQYKRGEAWGNLRLGNAYCSLGKYKESLASLNKAKKISESLNDNSLNAIISIETGRNYFESKVSNQQAIQQFLKAESYASKIKDKYDRETYLLYAYQSLMAAYSDTDKKDLAIAYAWKSLQIEEDAYTLAYVTHHHLNTSKNKDSIIYYLEKSTDFLKKSPELSFEKSILANQWGKYYEEKKQFSEAISHYKEAKKLSKESQASSEYLTALNGLAQCYEKLKNFEASNFHMKTFVRVQDSINKAEKKQVSNTVDNIVQEKEKGFLQQLSQLQKILAIILFVFLCIGIYFVLKLKKQNHHKIKMDKLLHEKEYKIAQHAEEAQLLKLKVNESFEEVIYLAKSNSPEFWAKFQEVYPNFQEKLLKVNPQIRTSELNFCAYLFLGFSTKEIAEYTFKAVKTVENNRYNIRKKLGISTESDLVVWLRDYIDSE